MPYSADKDRGNFPGPSAASFGSKSRPITPSDSVDLDPYAKAIVVTGFGNLVILPVENTDDTTITFTDAPVGFVPPFRVRRVYATGTSASVATIDG